MKLCCVDGCDRLAFCKGYCGKHYKRAAKGQDPAEILRGQQSIPHGWLRKNGLDTKHPFYQAWVNMKSRCDNSKSTQYKWYGGRGIRYCESWRLFRDFYLDMYPDWKAGLILDRIEGNEDYFKENCRWVSTKESQMNRSSTKLCQEDLLQICRLWETRRFTQTKLGEMFNISQGYVWHILDKAGLV